MDNEIGSPSPKGTVLVGTLVSELRLRGFTVTIDQVLSASRLALDASMQLGQDKHAFASLFCGSPEELSDFNDIWESLTRKHITDIEHNLSYPGSKLSSTVDRATTAAVVAIGFWQRYQVTVLIVVGILSLVLFAVIQNQSSANRQPVAPVKSIPSTQSPTQSTNSTLLSMKWLYALGRTTIHMKWLIILCLAIVLAGVPIFVSWNVKAVFKRGRAWGKDIFSPIGLAVIRRAEIAEAYDKSAYALHLWLKTDSSERVDCKATARATAKAAGRVSIRLGQTLIKQHLIMVVERKSGNDCLVDYVGRIGAELGNRSVDVEIYEVSASDSAEIYVVDATKRRSRASWSANLGTRAIMWTGPDLMSNPLNETMEDEIVSFLVKTDAVVVAPFINSPIVYRSLNNLGIKVLGIISGLALLRQVGAEPDARPMTSRPFPSVLRNKFLDWQSTSEETPFLVHRLLSQLHIYLGRTGMLALAACAAYPELRFDFAEEFTALFCSSATEYDDILSRLVQLPWLRYGYMPDWIRVSILLALNNPDRATLRTTVEALFQRRLGVSPDFRNYGIGRRSWWKALVSEGLERVIRSKYLADIGNDRVFITFILGEDLRGLLHAPAGLALKRLHRRRIVLWLSLTALLVCLIGAGIDIYQHSDHLLVDLTLGFFCGLFWYLTVWQLRQVENIYPAFDFEDESLS